MLERIKYCICHPRYIGKYNKDKVGKILLFSLMFFLLYLGMFAIRTFTENPLGDDADNIIVSDVIGSQKYGVRYDSSIHILSGDEVIIETESYGLYVLPKDKISVNSFNVNILLKEDRAIICQGVKVVSEVLYNEFKCGDFVFDGIASNNPSDIYNFRNFINTTLESSYTYYRTLNLIQGGLQVIFMYGILFLLSFVFAKMINPSIDSKVRAKLVMYDTIIYLVVAMLTSLFNFAPLIYVAYSLPIIYTSITFRHIVKVVIPKNVRGV